MIGIYKITNPKGKIYIGQSIDIEKRFKDYAQLSCRSQRRLFSSLKKYGFEQHLFETIEECEFEELNKRERHYQDYYNVLEEGLNLILTSTDQLNVRVSEETRLKTRNSKLGQKHTSETKELMSLNNSKFWKGKELSLDHRQKMSLAKKDIVGQNHPRYGKSHSEDAKQKMSLKKNKQVLDTSTNIIYQSAKEAAEILNINYNTLVQKLNGRRTNNTFLTYSNN